MEEFDAQCQFTTTMGADAYGTSLFAFVYYLIVLFPGLCVCLFINSVWKGIPKHIAHLSEALIYLLLAGGLLGLCVMLIISPFN